MQNINTPRIRFELPDMPGTVAALRIAYAQGLARQNAHTFAGKLHAVLEEKGISREDLGWIFHLAESMLMDDADCPDMMFTGSWSCLSGDLPCPDDDDTAAIDEMYGEGFTAALVASIPADYPKPVGTVWPSDDTDFGDHGGRVRAA